MKIEDAGRLLTQLRIDCELRDDNVNAEAISVILTRLAALERVAAEVSSVAETLLEKADTAYSERYHPSRNYQECLGAEGAYEHAADMIDAAIAALRDAEKGGA